MAQILTALLRFGGQDISLKDVAPWMNVRKPAPVRITREMARARVYQAHLAAKKRG